MQVYCIPLAQWPLVSNFFHLAFGICCVATYGALPASNTDALHWGVKKLDKMRLRQGWIQRGGGGGGCSPPLDQNYI